MNLYRGCLHDCAYCDGRAEKYRVDGTFGRDVTVKVNAVEVLGRELRRLYRSPGVKGGYFMVGGGVGDSYQPVEHTYRLTRRTLELLFRYRAPVHVLTKSTLVRRDTDILVRINDVSRTVVSYSFSSVDDDISARFEPHVPPPSERLATLAHFKSMGVATGMFLLPVIPFVTDAEAYLRQAFDAATQFDIDFMVFGGMTLKEGRQTDHFFRVAERHDPALPHRYRAIYRGDRWGRATDAYYRRLYETFLSVARDYTLPLRMPPRLYRDLLEDTDRAVVVLEHLDYLLTLRGTPSPYGRAAASVAKLSRPLSSVRDDLQTLAGVGPATEKIIREVLDTGTSRYLERLLIGDG
jgi:DNA repair photolyase